MYHRRRKKLNIERLEERAQRLRRPYSRNLARDTNNSLNPNVGSKGSRQSRNWSWFSGCTATFKQRDESLVRLNPAFELTRPKTVNFPKTFRRRNKANYIHV